ncbi:hypothetical protein SB48_HM08orf06376 [Heyndrickxia coagulans]|uniref:Uncharacterized protein n=1 Tax=Heyndrickxia coagulans TaxID=1398 RepID=A0AAN0TA51_HEYCO|nr:hypothetical protein SB48_HM08orf06376 [Heyndrickxia coagulans]
MQQATELRDFIYFIYFFSFTEGSQINLFTLYSQALYCRRYTRELPSIYRNCYFL